MACFNCLFLNDARWFGIPFLGRALNKTPDVSIQRANIVYISLQHSLSVDLDGTSTFILHRLTLSPTRKKNMPRLAFCLCQRNDVIIHYLDLDVVLGFIQLALQ